MRYTSLQRSGRRRVFIGLGSNQGDPERKLDFASAALRACPGLTELRFSSRRWTAPVGPVEQPRFLNAACVGDCTLEPEALLDTLHGIEAALGRERATEVRWGPRPIDLDLLLMDDVVRTSGAPILPHPEIANRRFVLEPLVELDPDARDPRTGQTVAELLGRLG